MKYMINYSILAVTLALAFVLPFVSGAQTAYPSLSVSCYPNTYLTQTNATVGWSSSVWGGNGYYTFTWSGTDNLYGNSGYAMKQYTTVGTKSASLTVTSGTQSATVNCGSTYINPGYQQTYPTYYDLGGSCVANTTYAKTGDVINWTASATGGNGTYSYMWSGDDVSYATGQFISKSYVYPGTKNMYVTITSNGQSIKRSCYTSIASIVNNTPSVGLVQNQVLAYTDTNPNISSITLSDVPYTGPKETTAIVLFIIAIVSWSSYFAYIFMKNSMKVQEVLVAAVNPVENKISNKINAEEKSLKQIEDYARTQKVLLSSEAVKTIFKLSKLGKINASDKIRELAKEDWTAVGEKDLY